MGPKVGQGGFLGARVGQHASKPTFAPALSPFWLFHESPLFTQFKGGENCFPKRALRQSRSSINLRLVLLMLTDSGNRRALGHAECARGRRLRQQTKQEPGESCRNLFLPFGFLLWFAPKSQTSQELKKAVAVSEEKNQHPAAFPQVRPIFQQPFSLPESAQTLAGIAFRAAGKSGNRFPAALKIAGKPFQQGISDSHSLLEFLTT